MVKNHLSFWLSEASMKIAILSDIHGNLEALKAVLKDIDKLGEVDQYWCLGDVTDYGPNPHQCLEIIRQLQALLVLGNHDAAVAGKLDYEKEFSTGFLPVTRWTEANLSSEDKDYLSGLPLKIETGDFTLVHGSPRDPIFEYILNREEAEENLPYFKNSYCLVGHTHISTCHRFKPGSSSVQPIVPDRQKRSFKNGRSFSGIVSHNATRIKLAGERMVINPGSVGKQRDGNPRASYAYYDSQIGDIELRKVEYDLTVTQKKIYECGLPEWLAVDLGKGI
jgi:predicted phosphodiesterase